MATVFDRTDGTRAEKIERFVELSAVNTLLAGGYRLELQEFFKAVPFDELMRDPSEALFADLWPDREEGDEYQVAQARADLLVAKMFERLASIGQREARFFRSLAATRLEPVNA
jgi:hypothetical protein